MIIKSTRKKDMAVNIQIRNGDGTSHPLVRKNHIKCLRVIFDESVSRGSIIFRTSALKSRGMSALYQS